MVVVAETETAPEARNESTQLFKVASPPKAVEAVAKPDTELSPSATSAENHSLSPVTEETPEVSEIQKGKCLEFPSKRDRAVQPELQTAAPSRSAAPASPKAPVNPAGNGDARRERLEKVKRKVAEAVRTEAPIEPVPEDPAQAAESVLGLVSDLETQLSRTRDLEKALRIDLVEAKSELARTATEGRTAAERLGRAEAQLDEKRKVLEEMLIEMSALEEERDQAVRRLQTLTAQDEDRQQLLDDLGERCTEMEKALSESKAEDERLSEELDEYATENTQMRAALSEVTRERDGLAQNVERLIKERDELIDAKKALEKVHQALAQARARLRN